ncbi:tRNA modification GTPase MnmE [Sulfitobacter noctilucicola]|uniref:tRNA modification GTPase MnmE n=1 Tax=Sulfitobacter noctilucicola TaxID=1342301 RepID=A0A7W6Q2K4_9RHOB|nr:tRNA uridine-5-carboxymethylaminomethyl(34) synthesis GTPase MnmE [Sulfitobacter noctilucicola]KIN62826.1 tRNA modification GTPase MnmE [Sulfitobacter noctilucicola]MBB4172643.1 tRNA modification GTPase [Sulfitobacter noctilucicola]
MDTIYAQATAQGRAGVAVVRISGPHAFEVAGKIMENVPAPSENAVRNIRGKNGELIDRGLVLTFKGPKSFTGEDVVELHLHGSMAVVQAVLSLLGVSRHTRLAEAGEFTRRALENGKLDLAQVEGLADLIDAETEAQRKQALRVLSGHLGALVDDWRKDLIRAAALLEATIDFADEEVPVDVTDEVRDLLQRTRVSIEKEVRGNRVAERIRNGFEVAIVGAPNVGKSTLLNYLAGRNAALTSDIAGTTRDIVEVRMDVESLPVTFLDTAGMRDTTDVVEAMGVELAITRARDADIRVFLVESDVDLPIKPESDDIVLRPKMDALQAGVMGVSGMTGAGVDFLLDRIATVLKEKAAAAGISTHERHRLAMVNALEGIARVEGLVVRGADGYDIAAEELRSATRSLEAVVGRIGVENLLDEIFSSFCIGK